MNTAKLTTDGTRQMVILPEDFQLTGTEVYIKKIGNAIVLIAKDNPWQSLIGSLDNFSDDFMNSIDQP
ncbi:AbrB/MazE/SpoVT family DNA-binding domain-containing protein [Nostoc sp. CHAB 5836]|uniref:antitoxin n=1 Tax=Nostoc sp. CHAB 5836 TaxID=2780404 RepID=UPI001E60807A|nr:AbrB/MazE/SpoVT family DNA-binding domain-containing protein [Nostoc sp. CHAB 5836]MCC5614615.1 AbrB/MazE/SpoVT family DNA-binding domain-containing protein [Nostoc sp. CHAB 5836]